MSYPILVKSIFQITRIVNMAIAFMTMHLIYIIAVFISPVPYLPFFMGTLSAIAVGMAANVINDIFDLEIDKINRPDRPIPSGRLSIQQSIIIYIVLLIISEVLVIQSFQLSYAFLIVTGSNVILFFYSRYFKRWPVIGNLVVAFVLGLSFLYAGILINNWSIAIYPAIFGFILSLAREVVKDMEDVKGDKAYGAITLPILIGIRKTEWLVTGILFCSIWILNIPVFLGDYHSGYAISINIFVSIPIIYMIAAILNPNSPVMYSKLSSQLKILIIPVLFSICIHYFLIIWLN